LVSNTDKEEREEFLLDLRPTHVSVIERGLQGKTSCWLLYIQHHSVLKPECLSDTLVQPHSMRNWKTVPSDTYV
jgi:hypothetical protein